MIQLTIRHGYLGGRDWELEAKEACAKAFQERKENQKRKHEDGKKEEADAQQMAWSRLEEIVGTEDGAG